MNKEGSVVTRFVTNSANQLTDMLVESGKQIHYTYDKHGNVTTKRYNSGFEINYEYNDLNQLVSLKDSDSREIRYRYDGLGNRIEKTETYDVHRVLSNQDPLKQEKVESVDVETLIRNAKEAYMASLESEKLCMMSETNTTQVTYTDTYTNDLSMENPVSVETYRNDTLVHTVVPQMMSLKHEVHDKKTLALQNVKQDSVVSVDIEGLVEEYDYDFFGRTQQIGAPILGYSGETHEGSLQYLRARYYDTETGVFISRDTYGGDAYDSGSQNRYIYAQNSNVNAIDPNGHFWGFVTNAVKKVVTKVVDVAKKVTNKVVASIPKPIKTVVSNIWQKAVTTTKKVLTTPTPVKSNPVKVVSSAKATTNASTNKNIKVSGGVNTLQQVKKTVNVANVSLQQKLSVQESQWKKEGLKPHEIDTKRLEFVKAYCDTLGLTGVQRAAIIAKYNAVEGAVAKGKQLSSSDNVSSKLLDYINGISLRHAIEKQNELNSNIQKYGYTVGTHKTMNDGAFDLAKNIVKSVLMTPVNVAIKSKDGFDNLSRSVNSALEGNWSDSRKYALRGVVNIASAGSDVALFIAAFSTGGSSIAISGGIKLTIVEGVGSAVDLTINLNEEEYDKALGNIGDIVAAFLKNRALSKLNSIPSKGTGTLNNKTPSEISKMSPSEIKQSLPNGWTYSESPDGRFIHIKDTNGNYMIRIDPSDAVTTYPHIHIFDSNGNALDINGNIVPKTSPDAHIPR